MVNVSLRLPAGLTRRYHPVRLLGQGGSGRAVEAWDRQLERRVVIKLLRPDAHDEKAMARFRREAAVLGRLRHPRIVEVLDFGETGAELYLIYPYLEGVSLDRILIARGRLSPDEVVQMMDEVLDGLEAIHEAGLVHRDLKPPNLLALKDGSYRLLDFGLVSAGVEATRMTLSGIYIGTPGYSPPEQFETAEPDARADLYSLGVTAYRCLTGINPFIGSRDILDIYEAHRSMAPPPLDEQVPGLSVALREVVEHLMQKRAEERPASAAEVRSRLRPCLPTPTREFLESRAAAVTEVLELPEAAEASEVSGEALPPSASRAPALVGISLLAMALVGFWLSGPEHRRSAPADPHPARPEVGRDQRVPGAGLALDLPERLAAELDRAGGRIRLADGGLAEAEGRLPDGARPVLDEDPLAWPEVASALPSLAEVRAFVEGGGQFADLPGGQRASLERVDARFAAAGLTRPLHPDLELAPLGVPAPPSEALRELVESERLQSELPDRVGGWLGRLSELLASLDQEVKDLEKMFREDPDRLVGDKVLLLFDNARRIDWAVGSLENTRAGRLQSRDVLGTAAELYQACWVAGARAARSPGHGELVACVLDRVAERNGWVQRGTGRRLRELAAGPLTPAGAHVQRLFLQSSPWKAAGDLARCLEMTELALAPPGPQRSSVRRHQLALLQQVRLLSELPPGPSRARRLGEIWRRMAGWPRTGRDIEVNLLVDLVRAGRGSRELLDLTEPEYAVLRRRFAASVPDRERSTTVRDAWRYLDEADAGTAVVSASTPGREGRHLELLGTDFPALAAAEFEASLARVRLPDGRVTNAEGILAAGVRPLLDPDPRDWHLADSELGSLASFRAFLAAGGEPARLPESWRERLLALDGRYAEEGLPRPFHPWLSLEPARESTLTPPGLRRLAGELGLEAELPPRLTGWLSTFGSLHAELEAEVSSLEARFTADPRLLGAPHAFVVAGAMEDLAANARAAGESRAGRLRMARVLGKAGELYQALVVAGLRASADSQSPELAACLVGAATRRLGFASHARHLWLPPRPDFAASAPTALVGSMARFHMAWRTVEDLRLCLRLSPRAMALPGPGRAARRRYELALFHRVKVAGESQQHLGPTPMRFAELWRRVGADAWEFPDLERDFLTGLIRIGRGFRVSLGLEAGEYDRLLTRFRERVPRQGADGTREGRRAWEHVDAVAAEQER